MGSGGNLSAAIQGAVIGGFSGGIGQQGGVFASRTAKAVAHGVVGGAQAAVNGGKFLRGFASSFFTKRFASSDIASKFEGNPVGGATAAAVVGGTVSVIGGGKFGNGASTNAFQYLFNEIRGNKGPAQRKELADSRENYERPTAGDLSNTAAYASTLSLATPVTAVAALPLGLASIGLGTYDYVQGLLQSSALQDAGSRLSLDIATEFLGTSFKSSPAGRAATIGFDLINSAADYETANYTRTANMGRVRVER